MDVITMEDLGLPASSVQGVATFNDSIYFVAKNRPEAKLVEVDTTGRLRRSGDIALKSANGIAVDRKRDALILLTDSGELCWIDRASWKPTGFRARVKLDGPDHLFHDQVRDRLIVSWGSNGKDGYVTVYQLPAMTKVGTFALQGADAIEGVAVAADGQTMLIANDAGTHEGYPRANRVLEYHLPI